jgi:AhpD family alkylhydroperoxidase
MTRIAGAERKGLLRGVYRYAEKQYDRLPEPTVVFGHHKKLLVGYGALESALERSHRVDDKLKAMAELKAAMLAGCEWCLDIGSPIARESGMTDDQLRDLHRHSESEHFSELERLVVDYAVGMTRTPVDVSDELFARLAEHFDEAQLVELTSAIAIENFRARFNWAFDMRPQGFSDGQYCVRPQEAAEAATT